MKGKALLFGLNYAHCKAGKLNGCINDVYNMAKYIHDNLDIEIDLYTDDTDIKNTSYDGIISNLHNIAIESYRENLDFIWIHFSGHGSQKKDTSGDEEDGLDEGIVPSDYEKKGILIDDIIHKIFCSFNPKTQILFICDSCHSGTILDLKYTWDANKQYKIDNKNNKIRAKTMLISGCQDAQTSADAYNLFNDNKSVGALSACILKVLQKKPEKIYNAFSLINSVRNELVKGGFSQYPCLSTNYDISQSCSIVPINSKFRSQFENQQEEQPIQTTQVGQNQPSQFIQYPIQQQSIQLIKPNSQYPQTISFQHQVSTTPPMQNVQYITQNPVNQPQKIYIQPQKTQRYYYVVQNSQPQQCYQNNRQQYVVNGNQQQYIVSNHQQYNQNKLQDVQDMQDINNDVLSPRTTTQPSYYTTGYQV